MANPSDKKYLNLVSIHTQAKLGWQAAAKQVPPGQKRVTNLYNKISKRHAEVVKAYTGIMQDLARANKLNKEEKAKRVLKQ